MSTPVIFAFWERLASQLRTEVDGAAPYTLNLTATDQVVLGRGPWPPLITPCVYLMPPQATSEHGISLGSFERRASIPFVICAQAGLLTTHERVEQAIQLLHEVLMCWELDRANHVAGPWGGGFPTVRDVICRSWESDDQEMPGASAFGIAGGELEVVWTVAPNVGGL